MILNAETALLFVARVIGVALLLQTVELWQLRAVAAEDGVWRWSIVRRDFDVFPGVVRAVCDRVLSQRGFTGLLLARGLCAATLMMQPTFVPTLFLLLSTLLISLRWRGSFNGGSDFMSLIVLSALSIATFDPQRTVLTRAALWYVAIHACNSYFLAGLVKLRTPNWRSGRALPGFLATTVYGRSPVAHVLVSHRWLSITASWFVIGLECAFPLALLRPDACLVLTALAFGFHLVNVYVFGLNRFLFVWAATYPALLWCSAQVL